MLNKAVMAIATLTTETIDLDLICTSQIDKLEGCKVSRHPGSEKANIWSIASRCLFITVAGQRRTFTGLPSDFDQARLTFPAFWV
ncbi:MAG: hypothetical protein Kow00121_08480 [Elainellaceae cyanobacterium]